MVKHRQSLVEHLAARLNELHHLGEYKDERVIISPQSRVVTTSDGARLLNLCANNYLGLADHPELEAAAKRALGQKGYGMASVRFICGTQEDHKRLERAIADFYSVDDAILYSSCFDANTGLFETLLDERDAIVSDSLNHASIVDGIRLCKARRLRYANNHMGELDARLGQCDDARFVLVATDSVFSMDGVIASLDSICDLADAHQALVMVDESHAMGVIGEHGGGAIEYRRVQGRVALITGTLGKALGGASGGFTAGNARLIAWLRQRSRPYLFSNTLAPVIAATSLVALDYLHKHGSQLRRRLQANTQQFRTAMTKLGFSLGGADHPIVPVLLGQADLASRMAEAMLARGVYVVGFSYPVVPKDQARIRVQLCATHTSRDIDMAVEAFAQAGRELGVVD